MNFFKNKLNIFLTIVLVGLIGAGVVLGLKFFSKPELVAVDFSNMSVTEVQTWIGENNAADFVEFEHEFDEVIEKDKVIYQSIKDGEVITDKILIIISDGPDTSNMIQIPVESLKTIESFDAWVKEHGLTNVTYEYEIDQEKEDGTILSIDPTLVRTDDKVTVKAIQNGTIDVPDFSYMTDDEIKKWGKDNGVTVSFSKEYSDLKEGAFIKQSVDAGKKVSAGATITISISKGKEKADGKSAEIDETKYLGVKEEDFLKALKDLGFTNVVKIDEVDSKKYDAGTICYYLPDGVQKLDTKIEYKVVKGAKEDVKEVYIDENKYLGMKEEDFLKELKELGFTNLVKIDETTSKKYQAGTICYYLPDGKQKTDTKIEYKIVKGETPTSETKTGYIHPTKYLGNKEADFVNELKGLGYTNIVKIDEVYSDTRAAGQICYYLPDGNVALDKKIEYKVSKGKEPVTPVTPVEKPNEDPNPDPQPEPKPIEVKTGTILGFEGLQNFYKGSSYDECYNRIKVFFDNGGFTNVQYKGVDSYKAPGTLISVTVGGNSAYAEGDYPVDTSIVVEICKTQIN